jgi:hypothetical protein
LASGKFGNGDGGKAICLDNHNTLDCTVFSFGIDFDFSFDLSMSKIGCVVHSFDHIMLTRIPFKPFRGMILRDFFKGLKIDSKLVKFYDSGLGAYDQKKKKIKRLKTYIEELNVTHIDVLKIDIDGNEWNIFQTLLLDIDIIPIYQLCIEIHLSEKWIKPNLLKIYLNQLNAKGYILWNRIDNYQHSKIVAYDHFHIRDTYELSFIRSI